MDIGVTLPDDLSVVILTYNRTESLLRCLQSVPEQLERTVADDGTMPPLHGVLPQNVKLYTHEHDGCRASTCRNEGARLATKPKILFLDDDVVCHPMAFAAHSIALNMYDISCGLLVREQWKPALDDRTRFYISEDDLLWQWCWSANLAVRTSVFWEVGGFDEVFNGGTGYEDIDWGRRAWLAKKRLHLNRLALVHHPSPHTAENPPPSTLLNQKRYEAKWSDG